MIQCKLCGHKESKITDMVHHIRKAHGVHPEESLFIVIKNYKNCCLPEHFCYPDANDPLCQRCSWYENGMKSNNNTPV